MPVMTSSLRSTLGLGGGGGLLEKLPIAPPLMGPAGAPYVETEKVDCSMRCCTGTGLGGRPPSDDVNVGVTASLRARRAGVAVAIDDGDS